MSTTPVASETDANMAINSVPNMNENEVQENANGSAKVVARLSGSDFNYLISKDKVVIGRNSSQHGKVDVSIGFSSYVSRKHLQIAHERGRFSLSCMGKNGVFVDGQFQRIGANPVPLDKTCVIRFPSTDIRLTFDPYPNDTQFVNGNSTQKSMASAARVAANPQAELKPPVTTLSPPPQYSKSLSPHRSDAGIRENNPEVTSTSTFPFMLPKIHRGVISAPPSPTGTISAMNSCPASPPSGVSHSARNVAVNLSAVASKIAAVVDGEQEERISNSEERKEKPPYSYAQLIIQAISSATAHQLTLSGIYAHITKNYPYYRTAEKGWQNSIRHNLSLNRYFIKVPRSQEESGKGSFWRVDPSSEGKLVAQAWRKRRQRTVTCLSFTNTISTISRSAPVSPDRSNPISPVSMSRSSISSSQEESAHILANFDNDSRQRLMQFTTRYPQSAPGSPSGHSVNIAKIPENSCIPKHRIAIMTQSGTQSGFPSADSASFPSVSQRANESAPVSTNTHLTTMENSMLPIIMQQPPNPSSSTPLAAFTAQQQQLFQQNFQQHVVMIAGQNGQPVPQAIPLNIVAAGAHTSLSNPAMPFVVPGAQQYVVKRINENPPSEIPPAKTMKTEDFARNLNESSVQTNE